MRSRFVVTVAVVFLGLTFVVDALTPQTLVIAILLNVPIVLAALTQSRSLTASLVGLSMFADVAAGAINAYREGFWSTIGVADRGLTLLSIGLVGVLCTTLQDRAKRVTRLAVRDARAQREGMLATAGERIRATLSSELVIRAIVRESLELLQAQGARFYPNGPGEVIAAPSVNGISSIDEPIPPEIASVTRRAIDDERILEFTGADAVSRLLLDRLAAKAALAIPIRDRAGTFGILLIARAEPVDEEALSTAWAYAKLAETALTQARLFDELARRNEELAERQEVIRDLVYALSHDLRTPLAALSVTLRQARDGGYGEFPPEYRDVLAASLVSIDDLRRLAETLLLVARIEAGEHRRQTEVVDLYAVAVDVVAEFEALAGSRGIAVAVIGDGGMVQGDRADLRRAIVNLVANAIQHTANGGCIDLAIRHEGATFYFEVRDNGFGVAAEQVPYLFQRFSGGHAGGGSGLGLYLVRRIAEGHQGQANFTPNQPTGSVFSLALPEYHRS